MKFFIADTHFGHQKLIETARTHPKFGRPFECIEEHDTYLVDEINAATERWDVLYILGDFCMKCPGRYRQRLKCQARLIRGNHDPIQASRNVFGEIPWMDVVKLQGIFEGESRKLSAVLSHAPFCFWIGSHRGWANIYGHCHGQREITMDQMLGERRRSLDVGVDNLLRLRGDFRPVSEQWLLEYMLSRSAHDDPSFYPNNQTI
jgi:calcineurin-like phosphoesterase family protein